MIPAAATGSDIAPTSGMICGCRRLRHGADSRQADAVGASYADLADFDLPSDTTETN
jgi:hypothetical protein